MQEKEYDFIVIGGGPAGSSVATLLAKMNYNIILFEKEKFPRRHVGESMLTSSYSLFEKLGVLEEMKERFIRKPGAIFSNSTGTKQANWCFYNVIKNESALAFQVDRAAFDNMLINNSRRSGVVVQEKIKVLDVDLSSPDSVKVFIEDESKESVEINGKFLIDASGQNALLANFFKSKIPYTTIGNRIASYAHWENVSLDQDLKEGNIKIVNLDTENGWMWLIPVSSNKLSIGVVVDATYYHACRKRKQPKEGKMWYQSMYKEVIEQTKATSNIIKQAKRVDKVVVISNFSYKNYNKFGANYATVGDAAGFIDPIFSSGVFIALKSADLLAGALNEKFMHKKQTALAEMYQKLDRAYQIIEQLIINFYDKDAIQFENAQQFLDPSFEKNRTALEIYHLLIAGKFFETHNRFEKTLSLLRDEKMRDKYKTFIKYNDSLSQPCTHNEALIRTTAKSK